MESLSQHWKSDFFISFQAGGHKEMSSTVSCWPIAPSYMWAQMRGEEGGSCWVSAKEFSCCVHRSPNKLWRSNSIFQLWFQAMGVATESPHIRSCFSSQNAAFSPWLSACYPRVATPLPSSSRTPPGRVIPRKSARNLRVSLICTANEGRWESNINVWLRFMYSQKLNCAASLFQKQNYNVLSPNFHIHVSVSDLYIPRISLPICCLRIYKLLPDTWMQELRTRPCSFISGNTWIGFTVQCVQWKCENISIAEVKKCRACHPRTIFIFWSIFFQVTQN